MAREIAILGPDGEPVVREARPPQAWRTLATTNFAAASHRDPDLESWRPRNASGASALFGERDTMVSRVHDLARNDGWAAGGVTRQVDAIVGAGWRLTSKPRHRSLGITPAQATELAFAIESAWLDFVDDPDCWCDVGRRYSMGGLVALAYRHRLMDGEALAAILWRPRGGPYATCVQILDPDRLSNPVALYEQMSLRQGVEMDADGAPVAYHIRKGHPGDIALGSQPWAWERVARETSFGRRLIVHAFEPERAGQVRGTPLLAPVVKKLKMLGRYDEAEMQAAVINAVLAAFVESPFDHALLAQMMGGDDDQEQQLNAYQGMRLDLHGAHPISLAGAKVNFLAPGEKVTLTNPNHPNTNFEHFQRGALRNVASALGMTYEQLSTDWGQVNYSSARAALIEVWRGYTARREHFATQFMQPIYAAWLEEAIERGRVALPPGAPDFRAKKAAYCAARWTGPGRGWVDPLKEATAAVTRVGAFLSTREREAAEQGGDWEEDLAQIARERARMRELGIDPDAELRTKLPQGTQPGADEPTNGAKPDDRDDP